MKTRAPLSHKTIAQHCLASYPSQSFSWRDINVLLLRYPDFDVLAFRGTEIYDLWGKGKGWLDVVRNLRIFPTVYKDMRGHSGYIKGAVDICGERLIGWKLTDRSRRVILTGHSLGGGIAIPVASVLKDEGYNVTDVVTFGAPPVLSRGFGMLDGINVTEYSYGNDIVPTLLWWTGRRHINLKEVGPRRTQWFPLLCNWGDHQIHRYIEVLDV